LIVVFVDCTGSIFRPITIIGTIGRVGTITNNADSAYYTVRLKMLRLPKAWIIATLSVGTVLALLLFVSMNSVLIDDAINEAEVSRLLNEWENYAKTGNIDGIMALLDERVEIEITGPTEEGYITAKYPLEYYKNVIEKGFGETTNRHYTRKEQEIEITGDEAIVKSIVIEGGTTGGIDSEIKVAEEMRLKQIDGQLKIVRLAAIVIPQED